MPKRRTSSGFTLVELVVVLGVIAILATVIILNLRNSAGSSGRDLATLSERDQVRAALQIYYFDHGGYPYISPDYTLKCVGSDSCLLADPTNTNITSANPSLPSISTKLSVSTALSALSVGNMPAINDSGGKEQGFVYLSCLSTTATTDTDGTLVCPSGTSYLTFPLNNINVGQSTQGGASEACQTVGIWNTPVAYNVATCAPGVINGGSSGGSSSGSTGGNQAVVCSGTVTVPSTGTLDASSPSSQTVIWNITGPTNTSYSYVWTNTQSSLSSGVCSSNTYNCQHFTETLSPTTDIAGQAASGKFQTVVTVKDQNGSLIGNGNCSVPIALPTVSGTCSVSPAEPANPNPKVGDTVTWTASPIGGNGKYSYTWANLGLGASFTGTGQVLPVQYTSSGGSTPNLQITSGGVTTSITCPTENIDPASNDGNGNGGNGTCKPSQCSCTNWSYDYQCTGGYYCAQTCTGYTTNGEGSDSYSNSNSYCCDTECAGFTDITTCTSWNQSCCS